MPARAKTPKEVVKINRLPERGQKLLVPLEVTRTGRNTADTADTITIKIPGFGTPVTIVADYILEQTREVIGAED